MQPYIRELFTDQVRKKCERIWNIQSFGERMGQAENFVFKVKLAKGKGVLRLTHSDRRSTEQIEAEIAFMRYLADGGVPVPRILPCPKGKDCRRIEVAQGYFTGILMEEVPGMVLSKEYAAHESLPEWIIREWGRSIGMMHRISAGLNDKGIRLSRHHWDIIYRDDLDEESPAEVAVLPYARKRRQIVDKFHSFKESPDSFGLIHMDLHQGNVIVSDDRFTCIDFDDASYHFFIQDIAMPLYYKFLFWREGDQEQLHSFFRIFIKAYLQEYSLDASWFEHLHLFHRIRDYDLKIVLKLWEIPGDDKLHQEIDRRMQKGNPLAEIPWLKWLEAVQRR